MRKIFVLGSLALCAMQAIAGTECAATYTSHCPPKPQAPVWVESMSQDNWGGWKAHVGISAAIGLVTNYAADQIDMPAEYRRPLAFGACLLPGLYREADTYYNKPEPGYRHGLFSGRDMISNAVGCGLGYLGYKGISLVLEPEKKRGSVAFTKSFNLL